MARLSYPLLARYNTITTNIANNLTKPCLTKIASINNNMLPYN